MRVAVLSVCLLACSDAPSSVEAPIDAPATVPEAFAAGWTLAEVTVGDSRGRRVVRVAPDAALTIEAWGAAVLRTRAPAGGQAPMPTAGMNLHVALAQLDADGRVTQTLTNRFDDRPARAAWARGRRVLAVVEPDPTEAGAWRVWHAYGVAADGTLTEGAMGFARGTDLAQLLTP
jgi:hypothetical protein